MKVVIVGGVAGGATAAARLRRLREDAEIVVIERSGFVSYANCGLPYYIGGEIERREQLTLQTPESFWRRFRIDVRTHEEVLSVDPGAKCVTVRRLSDGATYQETYDKLLLSPGARAIRPNLPGVDDPRIFTLRTVEDTLALHQWMADHRPKTATVVGGGFVGLEMAENLTRRGVQVTLVERLPQLLSQLDRDMACHVHAYLSDQGLSLLLGRTVAGFEARENTIVTRLEGGESLSSDLVLLALGVAPETKLAKEAGLTLGIRDSIAVNEHMETSAPGIYAVGDAVSVENILTHTSVLTPLAGPANRQGRIAADNMAGLHTSYRGVQGTSILKLFDLTVASTGLNERTAQERGIPFDRAVNFSASHATYYPGATNMTIKTLFDPRTGKLLGAQIVGFDGVDKRCDLLASAIRTGLTGPDLTDLELSYAPPFSSAKDPVNMVGYTIENILAGLVKQYHWDQVPALCQNPDVTLLDVRTPGEYGRGHIPGARNIPLDDLRDRLEELDPAKPVYVNCQSGLRSYLACRILAQRGFSCFNLSGGYRFYALAAREATVDSAPAHPCGLKIQ